VSANGVAILCPGQGAQKVGMGRGLAEEFAEARSVFDEAFGVLGSDFQRVVWEGPEEELRQTMHTQPALLVHSIAAWRVLEARGVRASFAAGHSLGEYSAHVVAGSLDYPDALRLVRRRGELMQEAGRLRPGTMAAVLGLGGDSVQAVCRATQESGQGVVVAANLNSPTQVVISGEIPAVEAAMQRAKEAGAKRVVPLVVSGAFHSSLMEPAAAGLTEAIQAVAVRDTQLPVVANATAEPVHTVADTRRTLIDQLLSPVRWEETVRRLLQLGARHFVEVGSGNVLRGLVRSVDREATLVGLGNPDELPQALAALAEAGVEVQV
jgi:[acyl-carrier-protein] S-malonyltransferase